MKKEPKTETTVEKEIDINQMRETDTDQPDQPDRKKSKKPLVIGGIVVLAVIIGAAGLWLGNCIYQYLYESTASLTIVSDDVYVNDLNVGGLTMEEARRKMTGIENELAAKVKVDITFGEKKRQLTKEEIPCSFDTDEIFEKIKAFSAEKGFDKGEQHFEITMTTDTSNIDSIVDKIAEDVYVEPVDARVAEFNPSDDDMFVFEDEQYGQQLDKKDLKKQLNAVFKDGGLSGSVKAKIDDIAPDITVDYLANNIVKLSSFSTESTNNANGNSNMKVSLKACNGSIIDPGETWSFNDCTGDSNLESNGYKEAGVIVDGERTSGIGGGICQSSTTIYNACLLCGMTVEERYCHYYQSTYADAGRDATIDYGNLDLKMSNPFDCQLFMKCWMSGTKLTCEIYGVQSPEFDQVKITTSDPDYSGNSYTVRAWRTYYLDGEKVKKEELPESIYYTK